MYMNCSNTADRSVMNRFNSDFLSAEGEKLVKADLAKSIKRFKSVPNKLFLLNFLR